MLKMLKYEFRRGWLPLSIVFIIYGVLEIYFLIGTSMKANEHTVISAMLLMLLSFACYAFVLIYGIVSYNNDLKNKSGYLVYMSPVSSYGIVGAKLLSTLLTGVTLVVFIGFLFVVDYSYASHIYKFDGIVSFIQELFMAIGVDLKTSLLSLLAFIVSFLIQFFMITTVIYLAISLSSTVLQNKKGKDFVSGILAFILLGVINYLAMKLMIPDIKDHAGTFSNFMDAFEVIWKPIVMYLFVAIVSYIGSSILLEKKISL